MKRYFKEIEEEIESLKKEHNLIIVEGKKDRNALLNIGFKGDEIFLINRTGNSLYVVIDDLISKIGKKRVCILTDMDKKGRQLYHKIKERLDENGAKTNGRLRHLLIKEGISHIEGLDSYVRNSQGDFFHIKNAKTHKKRNKNLRN